MATNCYGIDCTGWAMIHPRATIDMLGYVPDFLSDSDPRPAREQFDENYQFGGWKPIVGFTLDEARDLHYPGDPPLPPVAERKLRDERILMYPHALFVVIQPDGSFEVARLD